MAVVLASKSPRRRELLGYIIEAYEIAVSNEEEKANFSLSPDKIAADIARQKAKSVAESHYNDVVIGADTIVVIDGEILGKPTDREQAFSMLRKLSGRTHSVFTGVCIISGKASVSFAQETEVEFYELSDDEINDYLDTGDSFDKAGAYGIQQKGAALVKGINGDFYNVMGLPVARLKRELVKLGVL